MDFNAEPAGRYIRIVAIIALLLGLNDAARLLGVSLRRRQPDHHHWASTGFTYLAIFCLARLFAAVGLWIKASWGAVLLVGATGVELMHVPDGQPRRPDDAFGFAVRLVLLIAIS